MPRYEPGRFHVVTDLDTVLVESVKEGAVGDGRQALDEHVIQFVAVAPGGCAFFAQFRQRLPQNARQLLALHIDAVFP